MKMIKYAHLLILGLLLASSCPAFSQDTNDTPYKFRSGRTMLSSSQRLEQFSTELKLTDDEKPKVKAVLDETAKKVQELLKKDPSSRPKNAFWSIIGAEQGKLKDILTTEQLEKSKNLPLDRPGGPVSPK